MPSLNRAATLIVASALVLSIPSVVSAQAIAPSTPSYRLEVGQQLRYRYEAEFQYQRNGATGTQTAKGIWDLWVLAKNDDQSWTIAFVQELQLFQKEGLEQYEGPKQSDVMRFELYPDGRLATGRENLSGLDPRMVFPALPLGAEPVWADVQPSQTLRYRRLDSDAGPWTAECVHEGLIHDAILKIVVSKFEFAPGNDRVERVTSDVTLGFGSNGKGTSTITYESTTKHPPEVILPHLRDASGYFSVVDELRSALRAANYGLPNWEATLAQGSKSIAALVSSTTTAPYADKIRNLQSQYEAQKQPVSQQQEHRKKFIGQPGPTWTRKDFANKERTSDEFKGKVTVLAFWNRANNWSIRMLPGIKTLAQAYADRPVRFVSMNNDRFRVDADFVLDRAQLPFETIGAAGVSELYGARVYPVIVILAADGTVANFHEGYTEHLFGDVRRDLDGLLTAATKQPTSKPTSAPK